jgi:hypothetical protein
MADYAGGTTQFERVNGIGGFAYCADAMCETTARFDFADEHVVRVWFDTD